MKWGFLPLIAFVYILLTIFINHSLFRQTDYSYFNYLLDAFLHGRLNVIHPRPYDLSLYRDQFFLYWGPAPVIFISPFYLVSKINTSDVFYTVLAGITNVVLFYFVITEAVKFFRLHLSYGSKVFIVASFAFASPNFYLSLGGRIWHTSQVIAVLYLLACLYFYFRFLNYKSRILFFALSLFFFHLAWLSRQSLIYYAILFVYPFILYWKDGFKKIKKLFVIFVILTVFFSILFLSYNYLRFGNVLETGIKYQLASSRYNKAQEEGNMFSLSYVSHNIQYQILNSPSFSSLYPYIAFDPEGNSIFFVYPLLFTLIYFIGVRFRKTSIRVFLLLATSVILLTVFTIFTYLATGWYQFGSRYFFDVIPLLFLFTVFIVHKIPVLLKYILFFYGVAVNIIGALTFPWFR